MTMDTQSKEACEIFESIVEAYERLFKNAPPLRLDSADKVKKEIEGQIKIASAYSELGLYQYCPDKIEDWRKRLRTVAESIKILSSE